MKSPAGQPRALRPAQKKPVQLNLRRASVPDNDGELEEEPSNFWKWFGIVLLAHVIVFALLLAFHRKSPAPPPQFISLLPPGDVVKGTAGAQSAPTLAPTTAAAHHAASLSPPPSPRVAELTPPPPVHHPPRPKIHHVQPAPLKLPPLVEQDFPDTAPKPTPPKPSKPKIKVDLSQVVDAPDEDQPRPVLKPKPHVNKKVRPVEDTTDDAASAEDTNGLSEHEVAARLGAKLKAEGTEHATRTGTSGSTQGHQNEFAEFYNSLSNQANHKWQAPAIVDPLATNPVVRIHVEKDGRVPPDQVTLARSSDNPAIDQSALEAARGLGYTLQPLPDGCPPDITVTFDIHSQP